MTMHVWLTNSELQWNSSTRTDTRNEDISFNQDTIYAWSQPHREVYMYKPTPKMRTPPLIRTLA